MDEHYESVVKVICAESRDESQKLYDGWSDQYDNSLFDQLGFMLPQLAAETLTEKMDNVGGDRKNGRELEILDIGAGWFNFCVASCSLSLVKACNIARCKCMLVKKAVHSINLLTL